MWVNVFSIHTMSDDFFADFDEEVTSTPVAKPAPIKSENGDAPNYGGNPRGGRYPDELFSEKIMAKHRTFFVDVKEGSNGRFVKISEKSRNGKRSTVMMDAEDVPAFIQAMQKAQEAIER